MGEPVTAIQILRFRDGTIQHCDSIWLRFERTPHVSFFLRRPDILFHFFRRPDFWVSTLLSKLLSQGFRYDITVRERNSRYLSWNPAVGCEPVVRVPIQLLCSPIPATNSVRSLVRLFLLRGGATILKNKSIKRTPHFQLTARQRALHYYPFMTTTEPTPPEKTPEFTRSCLTVHEPFPYTKDSTHHHEFPVSHHFLSVIISFQSSCRHSIPWRRRGENTDLATTGRCRSMTTEPDWRLRSLNGIQEGESPK